jgi:anti-sigma factor RsiW
MQCSEAEGLLSPFLDDEIGGSERVDLERHLSACAACRGKLAALSAIQGAVRRVSEEKLPPRFSAELASRLRGAAGAPSRSSRARRLLWPLGVAAAGLLAFGVWASGPRTPPRAPAVARTASPAASPRVERPIVLSAPASDCGLDRLQGIDLSSPCATADSCGLQSAVAGWGAASTGAAPRACVGG